MVLYRKPEKEGNLVDPQRKGKGGSGQDRTSKNSTVKSETPAKNSTSEKYDYRKHTG